jgi:hypothetical protein
LGFHVAVGVAVVAGAEAEAVAPLRSGCAGRTATILVRTEITPAIIALPATGTSDPSKRLDTDAVVNTARKV